MKLRNCENMEVWKCGNGRVPRLVSRALTALIVSASAYFAANAADAQPDRKPEQKQQKALSAQKAKPDAGGAKLDAKSADVCRRMKAIVLPEVSFEPSDTLIDAVAFFRSASAELDSPELPKGERGFNFILEMGPDGIDGIPALPEIKLKNIQFYEALKIVCEKVGYQVGFDDGIVKIKPKGESKK